MLKPEELEELKEAIARLEHAREQEAATRSINRLKKTGKLTEEGLEVLYRQSVAFHNLQRTDLSQDFLKKELDKLIRPDFEKLDEIAQKEMEERMRKEGLGSYKLALEIQQLGIPQLVENLSKELKEAEEGLKCALKVEKAFGSEESAMLSETQIQKIKKLGLFIIKIKEQKLCNMLVGKGKKWHELNNKLLKLRKDVEIPKISEPGLSALQDCVLHTMTNPSILAELDKLIKGLQALSAEFTRNQSAILAVGLKASCFEETRQENLQKKALKAQTLEKQKQDFVKTFRTAEKQAQHLAKKEVNTGKPQAGIAVQESKLEDEEMVLIRLRKFLDDRIESSKKGLKEFGEGTLDEKRNGFYQIFRTKALFDRLGKPANEIQSQFLEYLYKSNEQYYMAIKKEIELLKTPITLVSWSRFLEKIRALDTARFEDAKRKLEELGINDESILTQLLIPVYRLVFKFQKEQLLSLTRQICEAEVRVLSGRRTGLLSSGSSTKSAAVKAKSTTDHDLENIFGKNLSPLEIVSEVSFIAQTIREENLQLEAQTHTASHLDEALQAPILESLALSELSFSSENFVSNRELLQTADAFNIISNLFSNNPTVGYKDFYNMLRDLRSENRVTDSLNGHVMFQFPILWNGMRTAPQVLVGIRHTSGMPTASQIQDPNILRDLRNACREAGMTPVVIEAIQADPQNVAVTQRQATDPVAEPVAADATVSSEIAPPDNRRTGLRSR